MPQNEEKILEFLKKQDWPVTTEQIAKELKISWQLHKCAKAVSRR